MKHILIKFSEDPKEITIGFDSNLTLEEVTMATEGLAEKVCGVLDKMDKDPNVTEETIKKALWSEAMVLTGHIESEGSDGVVTFEEATTEDEQ